ncbi:M23 family metallopeptidase [Chloroflexales bacterium ZM16-3]|nr:M23 family metallopeptidase [Chloroflexales bacterium ZM16-3]
MNDKHTKNPTTGPVKQASGSGSFWSWLYPLVIALVGAMAIQYVFVRVAQIQWRPAYSWSLYLGLYLICSWVFKRYVFRSANTGAMRHPALDWPVPGPIRKAGRLGQAAAFLTATFLSVFNPFLLLQQLRLTFGQMATSRRLAGSETDVANYQTRVTYRLPLEGEWLVYHGGHTPETSHSWQVLNQRYAYDFVKADSGFSRHRGTGRHLKDYYCYGEAILAAADGEVVAVHDGHHESPFTGYFMPDFLATQLAGNHVIIRHDKGEYGFYAHLIPGSIPVGIGDKVAQGGIIGRCGFSGNSTEPHLHFHLQDGPDFYSAMGLPVRFADIVVDGAYTDDVVVERGMWVSKAGSPAMHAPPAPVRGLTPRNPE